MNVERIYRRQWLDSPTAFIRDLCQEVGYNGRYLWLVPTKTVLLMGPWSGRNSHIRYRMAMLYPTPSMITMHYRRGRRVSIRNRVIIAVPTLHGRKRSALLFMNPYRVLNYKWCKATSRVALPEEVEVLRKQPRNHDKATTEVARALCIHRQLMTHDGNLTPDGLELLKWYDAKQPLLGRCVNTEKSA